VDGGACLEVMAGDGDVAAIAAGPPAFPWWAFAREGETVIESAATRQPLAWFPAALHQVAADRSGRLWAGIQADHVCVFALQDEQPQMNTDQHR
jgi:hypothetical protein